MIERFSHSFSLSQQSLEVRKLVKRNALRQITGDFDVPFWLVKDSIISGQTFKDVIIFNSGGTIQPWELDSALNLSISIPVFIDSWDELNFQPSTVIIHCGYDDMVDTVLAAYNNLGQLTYCSADTLAVPIYVVQFNQERLNNDGSIIYSLIDADQLLYSEERSNFRLNGDPEAIRGYQIPNLQACEAKFNGKPEVLYKAIAQLVPTLRDGDVQSFGRSAYGQATLLAAKENILPAWFSQVQGSFITYVWYESDGGSSTQTITATIPPPPGSLPGTPSVSTTLTIKKDDDPMGYGTVFREDPLSFEYSGSNIRWKMQNTLWP